MMPLDIPNRTTLHPLDPTLFSQMLGETAELRDCTELGRRLVQLLLIAPKRTEPKTRAAERLVAVLSLLLPVLEEPTAQDVWDIRS